MGMSPGRLVTAGLALVLAPRPAVPSTPLNKTRFPCNELPKVERATPEQRGLGFECCLLLCILQPVQKDQLRLREQFRATSSARPSPEVYTFPQLLFQTLQGVNFSFPHTHPNVLFKIKKFFKSQQKTSCNSEGIQQKMRQNGRKAERKKSLQTQRRIANIVSGSEFHCFLVNEFSNKPRTCWCRLDLALYFRKLSGAKSSAGVMETRPVLSYLLPPCPGDKWP